EPNMRPRKPTMPSETELKVSVNLSQRLTSKFVSVLMVHLSICRFRLSAPWGAGRAQTRIRRRYNRLRRSSHKSQSKFPHRSGQYGPPIRSAGHRITRRVPFYQYTEGEKAFPRLLDK